VRSCGSGYEFREVHLAVARARFDTNVGRQLDIKLAPIKRRLAALAEPELEFKPDLEFTIDRPVQSLEPEKYA